MLPPWCPGGGTGDGLPRGGATPEAAHHRIEGDGQAPQGRLRLGQGGRPPFHVDLPVAPAPLPGQIGHEARIDHVGRHQGAGAPPGAVREYAVEAHGQDVPRPWPPVQGLRAAGAASPLPPPLSLVPLPPSSSAGGPGSVAWLGCLVVSSLTFRLPRFGCFFPHRGPPWCPGPPRGRPPRGGRRSGRRTSSGGSRPPR